MKDLAMIVFGALLSASIQMAMSFDDQMEAERYRDEELKILREQRKEDRRRDRDSRNAEREYCLQTCREECRR